MSDAAATSPIVIHPYELVPPTVLTAVKAVIARAEAADGVEPLGEQFALGLMRSGLHFVASIDGVVCGYLGHDGASAEMVVDPAWRRRGVGTRLLAQLPPQVAVWAHGFTPAAEAFAAARGLSATRELLQMSRRGPVVEQPESPAGEELWLTNYPSAVKKYGHDKVDKQWLAVNNAAFDWHPEQGGWTLELLDERRAVPWFDPAGVLFAFDLSGGKSTLVAFHWTKLHSEELGEVYVVGVDPAAQGRGFGKLITAAGLHYLTAGRGVEEVVLYVEADNIAAVKTYERQGFQVSRRDVQVKRQG